LKLSGAQHLLVCSAYVNILGGGVRTLKKNITALLLGSNETGLDVNADKTKYMAMSRDQNAGRSRNIKIDNSSFERVEDLKCV